MDVGGGGGIKDLVTNSTVSRTNIGALFRTVKSLAHSQENNASYGLEMHTFANSIMHEDIKGTLQ